MQWPIQPFLGIDPPVDDRDYADERRAERLRVELERADSERDYQQDMEYMARRRAEANPPLLSPDEVLAGERSERRATTPSPARGGQTFIPDVSRPLGRLEP